MATTRDFDKWLDSADLDEYEEIYSLFQCVSDRSDNTPWECSTKEEQLFVKSPLGETLRLASHKAAVAFLNHIEERYCDGLDIESWYGLQHALARNP